MTDDRTKRVLRFEGALTLPEAESIRASLLAALHGEACAIELDCSGASEVDVSFLQLMLAARRAAALGGKSIAVSLSASDVLRGALERSGLPAENAFWTAGGEAS